VSSSRTLSWLWRRLRVMSVPEVLHRLRVLAREGLARAGEWWRPPGWQPVPEALLEARFLQAEAAQLFLPPLVRDPGDEARLLAGELRVFGHWVPVGPGPGFWHTDPLFHSEWPRVPSRQIDYRPGNRTGDVRVIWEVNRLQHLFELAVIAAAEPGLRTRAVARLEQDLHAWHGANPPGTGVNYLSAMEEALRLISLFHAYDLVRRWVGPQTRALLAGIAVDHARHVDRRLSLYSSAGNHTIAEATGLLYAGVLLPEFPGAAAWRETGRRLLRAEAARQVDADGGGLEQATWYLLFIADLLGLAQALLAHRGEPPEPAVDAAVARSRAFLNTLATGPLDLPRIGDADDGHALAPGLRLSWVPAGAAPAQRSWPTTGLSLVRFGGADRLVFLHNPLGMAPGFGHGHADCLSLVFRWAGADLLTDPGTYLYGAGEHRRYFRSAAGHNTATVDGADPAEQAGAFLWRKPYQARLVYSRFEHDGAWLLASHDGYAARGLTHWRGVVYRAGRYLAVWDHFDGPADADVRLHWHLGCPARAVDLHRGRLLLEPAGGRPVPVEISGGSLSLGAGLTAPTLLGWRSPRYGALEPCPVVEVRVTPAVPRRVWTVFQFDGLESAGGLERDFAGFEAQVTAPAARR